MSLVKCPECGRDISDQASACPGCGAPGPRGIAIERGREPGDATAVSGTNKRHTRVKWPVAAGATMVVVALAAWVVVAGSPLVEVPSLTGRSEPEAKAVLAAAGLTAVALDERYSDFVARGELLKQAPEPGAIVWRGSKVAIGFSAGPTPKPIPSVVGMAETNALSTLQGAGFLVEVARSHSFVKQGTVAIQLPSGGLHQPGETVYITVSEGWQPTASPSTSPASPSTSSAAGSDYQIHSYSPSVESQTPAGLGSSTPVNPQFDPLKPEVSP